MSGATVGDRARGALVGLATGDAVGTTVEFQSPGTFEPVTDMVGGGPFDLEPGQWTDDTSMALCLAESLVHREGHDPADQMRRYVRWWRDGHFSPTGRCFDIGITTRSQLARFERTGTPHDPHVDEESAANGSLMRLAPVAIRWSHDPAAVIEQAAASSRPTHPASRPVDACKVLAAMTAALIRGEPRESVFAQNFWQAGPLHSAVEAVARGSWQGKEPPEICGTGYCVAALEAAIWAVAGSENFRDAILRSTNLGDDADTTAAIAGQLAGALYGVGGIPQPWLAKLAMRERIESLADALHRAAVGERLQWDHDLRLHAWWADAEGRLLAGEYPGHGLDVATTRQKLGLLAAAGITTIIDLTDIGDGLATYQDHLPAIAAEQGIDMRRVSHPIPDVSVTTLEHYEQIVADIEREVAAGGKVFVHCWGGVGRTGTRKAGRPAPETPEQVEMLHEMERRIRGGG